MCGDCQHTFVLNTNATVNVNPRKLNRFCYCFFLFLIVFHMNRDVFSKKKNKK